MKRVGLFDEIRGFAIICMVVYHVMFDLKNLYDVNVPIFFESWFYIIRNVFAGTFIFISGCVCNFSSNNLKRGAQCFFLGMIVTFVVAFVAPDYPIYFGILHLLGICMIIYGLTERFWDFLPPLIGIVVFSFLYFFCFNIPNGTVGIMDFNFELPKILYDAELLFPLGFLSGKTGMGDYFPLIPWFFVFAAGIFLGVYAKANRLPRFFYQTHIGFLSTTGKYTIWIYLFHQPIAIAVLNLIFNDGNITS